MNRLIFLIFLIYLLMTSLGASGQVLLTICDSLNIQPDTTILLVLKDYRGNIQWQESTDGKTWYNLKGKVANSLIVKPDHEASYRAMISEGTCNPVYSDSAVIIFTISSLTTFQAKEITSNSAVLGGLIISTGGCTTTDYGICFSSKLNPTITDSKLPVSNGSVMFYLNLAGLSANTTYFVRTYAVNCKGTAYGPQVSFTTAQVYSPPAVVTSDPSSVTTGSALLGGTVTSDGNAAVTDRGIVCSVSQYPTTSDNKVPMGSGTGPFSGTVTGLTPNTPYYARAYAINSQGTAYGPQVSFTTKQQNDENTVTDIDGNIYPTVKIGEQTWMKENLRVTHTPDGTAITGFIYNNNKQYELTCGRLYTWDVAMNGSTAEQAQGICPNGWHIPSDEEVKVLEIYLGMSRAIADLSNIWRGAPVGTLMKVGGSSGFGLQLAGLRLSSGTYYYMGVTGYLWTSTASGNNYAWRRCFDTSSQIGRWNTWPVNYGLSVRCIKN